MRWRRQPGSCPSCCGRGSMRRCICVRAWTETPDKHRWKTPECVRHRDDALRAVRFTVDRRRPAPDSGGVRQGLHPLSPALRRPLALLHDKTHVLVVLAEVLRGGWLRFLPEIPELL